MERPATAPRAITPARATIPAPPAPDLLAQSQRSHEGDAVDEHSCDSSGVYEARLTLEDLILRGGTMDSIPVVKKSLAEVRELPLDPASGFLMSVMDGMLTVEMLIDMCAVPREAAIRSLCLLFDQDVVTFV